MPQEFQVLCCFKCDVFQVHHMKKAKKWHCKICNEKQSFKKAYGISSAPECRSLCQKLNMQRGGVKFADKTDSEEEVDNGFAENEHSSAVNDAAEINGFGDQSLSESEHEREDTRNVPSDNAKLPVLKITAKRPSSAPSPEAGPSKKPKGSKDDFTTFKTAIIRGKFPAEKLTEDDLKLIFPLILSSIDKIIAGTSEGPLPLLRSFSLVDGALVYSCDNKSSCDWLKATLENKCIGEMSPLRVVDPKTLSKPVTVSFKTKDLVTTEASKLFARLQVYNPQFRIKSWRVLDQKVEESGQQLVLLVDRISFDAIQKANFKGYTGMDQGRFKVLFDPKSKPGSSGSLLMGGIPEKSIIFESKSQRLPINRFRMLLR